MTTLNQPASAEPRHVHYAKLVIPPAVIFAEAPEHVDDLRRRAAEVLANFERDLLAAQSNLHETQIGGRPREAWERVSAAVNRREEGVQNDRRRDERLGEKWDDIRLADERSFATVGAIRLDDLQAILSAASEAGTGDDTKQKGGEASWSTRLNGTSDDLVAVPRGVLASACYIIGKSEHADTETAKQMAVYALWPTFITAAPSDTGIAQRSGGGETGRDPRLSYDQHGNIELNVAWSLKPGQPTIVAICSTGEAAERYRSFAEQHHRGTFYVETVLLDHAFGRRDVQSAVYSAAIRDLAAEGEAE